MGLEASMGSPSRGGLFSHYPALYNRMGEIQNQLVDPGKPVNYVNLDGLLLKSMVPVDDNQVASSSSSNPNFSENYNFNALSRNKTVDEALREIVEEQSGAGTFSDQLTLEEFLIRNQRMNPQPLMAVDPTAAAEANGDWLPYQMAVMGSVESPVFVDPMSMGYSERELTVPIMGSVSSESMVCSEKKRRVSVELLEKTIEKRQKRMIKNRESAARSRARKQAYTLMLEEDVRGWTIVNQRLQELMEMEMQLDSEVIRKPKHQLRRANSTKL